jgi:hypothetical protein
VTSRMNPAPTQAATVEWKRRDVQIGVLFRVVIITALATMIVSLRFPEAGEGGFFSYASVEPERAFVWGLLTLAGVNVVASVVSAALVGVLLTPRRGWQWTTAGFVVAIIGCALYAIGVGGWAMVYFFATDSAALDPATAGAFIESVNADAFHLFAAPFGGAIFGTIATVLFAVGLWRSGNLPKWVIMAGVVGSIVTFLPPEGVVGALLELPQAIASVLAAWYLWQQRHALYGGPDETPVPATAA